MKRGSQDISQVKMEFVCWFYILLMKFVQDDLDEGYFQASGQAAGLAGEKRFNLGE